MFTPKSYSFDVLKERVQNAQQGLSDGWKNITDKAKKEVKIVNKIARKALATEDGGKLRDGYVTTVNLDAGYDIFKEFQNNWRAIHKDSVTNVNKAVEVDRQLTNFTKEWQKWESYLEEFRGNLIVLPEVISKVEIIQKRIDAIGLQTQKIEDLLLEYEDACERYELEKCKVDMRVKLSQTVEAKHAEYTLQKSQAADRHAEPVTPVLQELSMQKIASFPPPDEVSESKEKQRAYEDAFLDQMNQYIKFGEIEKPIAGSLAEQDTIPVEDINIDDSDLSTLREFLGPEEMNSLIEVQASQIKASRENEEGKSKLLELASTETSTDANSKADTEEKIITSDRDENKNDNPVNEVTEKSPPDVVGEVPGGEDTSEKDNRPETADSVSSRSVDKNINNEVSVSDDDENEFYDAPSDNGE